MSDPSLFKWRHFQADIILCAVRWYLRYALSYRDVEELLRERGVWADHTTVYRWVQRYAPELDRRCRRSLRATNDSYRVDETYIKIKKQWHYLYRAVDSTGATLDFMLSATRDADAAEQFFRESIVYVIIWSAKISATSPFTRNRANSARERLTISLDLETIMDLRLKRPNPWRWRP